jgi:uncharacterized delta-60 repeat protein
MAYSRPRIAALLLFAGCAGGQGRDDEGALPASESSTESSTTAPEATTHGGATSTAGDATRGDATTQLTATTGPLPDDTTTDVVGGCGDGVVEPPELCDDGNLLEGDGCNADCRPSGEVLWSLTYGGMLGLVDEAMNCAVDGNDSIYLIGYLGVSNGDDDLWIRKYAADGQELWTQTYAGAAGGKDQGRALAVDIAETVYVAGYAVDLVDDNDIVVRKHAADGSPLWTRKFAGADLLSDVASGAQFTPDGDLIVVGATTVTGAGTNTWLRKYSPAGDVLWTRTYDGAAKGNDGAHAVAVTDDGYIYAVGYEAVPGEGNNMWVGKYDADGNLLWSRLYNGAASKADYLHAAVATDDGGVVVCGYETAADIPWRSFLRRYDADGLTVWTRLDDGPEAAGALCYGLDRTPDGDLLFAGAAIQAGDREPWLRRLDPDGEPRWSTIVTGDGGGASHARCLRPAPDGSLVAAGTLDDGVDGRDVWVARLSP